MLSKLWHGSIVGVWTAGDYVVRVDGLSSPKWAVDLERRRPAVMNQWRRGNIFCSGDAGGGAEIEGDVIG